MTKNISWRIFNTKTKSFLVNEPNLLEVSTNELELNISKVFKRYRLTPLFRFHNSLVFFAKDKKGRIHLVNRHLLEYLKDHPTALKLRGAKEFSVVVAPNIGRFVALFDRGLIPINFHHYLNGRPKLINLSGLPISKNIIQRLICFQLDEANQTFVQTGQELDRLPKKYLAIKVNPDVNYIKQKNRLVAQLNVSVFLE